MPEIVGLMNLMMLRELALEEHVSARLIRQKQEPNEWHVKSSPR